MSVMVVPTHELVYGADDIGELSLGDAAVSVDVVELERKFELIVGIASQELR